jgi:hypothetical protein
VILYRKGARNSFSLGGYFKWNLESKLKGFLDVHASHREIYTSICPVSNSPRREGIAAVPIGFFLSNPVSHRISNHLPR